MNASFWSLAAGVLLFLGTASLLVKSLVAWNGADMPMLKDAVAKVRSWWVLVGVGLPVLAMGAIPTTLLFAFLSFLVLREFLSLTPTRPGDRLALFTAFFVAIPAQYLFVGLGWYGMFSVLLPVYGFFVLSAVSVVAQDTAHFLERNAKIQWAVMVCIYGISHAPALLFLDIPNYSSSSGELLLFFLLIVQLSDVFQYGCNKLFGQHKLAPVLHPSKTWEGVLGGGALSAVAGMMLSHFTPFSAAQAGLLSLSVVFSGVVGGLVLAAVKRSLNAKDWGANAQGQGGMLDRLDSVAFAAPIFFHLTRYFFVPA